MQTKLDNAIERIARLQGVALDRLQLASVLAGLPSQAKPLETLRAVGQQLGWDAPIALGLPDQARLPSLVCLCQSEQAQEWAVLESRQADGRWNVKALGVSDQVAKELLLSDEDLSGRVYFLRPSVSAASASSTGTVSAKQTYASFQQAFQAALKPYRSVVVEAALAGVFIAALALGISMFSMQVYDRVIPTRGEATLITLFIGVSLAILVELVMKLARSRILESMNAGFDARLSRDVFARLLNVRIDQLPGSVGSLASQLRSYEQIRSYYTGNTFNTYVELPIAVGFVLLISMIGGPYVGAVPLIAAVFAIGLGLLAKRKINALAAETNNATNAKTGLLVEAVEGAETIKVGAGSWKFLSRWIDLSHQSIRSDAQLRRVSEHLSYFSATLQQISYAGLVGVGAWVVMRGEMTMGSLIACSILSGRVMNPILALPGLMVSRAHAATAFKSLEMVYKLKTDNQDVERALVPEQLRGAYKLTEARFAYGAGPAAIQVDQLSINAGERIAILGPIGSGKSTLLKMLAGLYQPTQGRLTLDGLELSHIARASLSQHVGYLSQDHRLFQGSLRENLLIGLADPGDSVITQALEQSGLLAMVSNHPKGLDLPIFEGGRGLSGGQKQLLAFTRLLLTDPQIVLLDEPTASMDEAQERRCLAVLHEQFAKGKTGIVVTHRPSVLQLVDRVIVVANGKVVADGPKDQVLRSFTPQPAANRRATDAPAPAAPKVTVSYAGQKLAEKTPAESKPLVEKVA